jgi:CRP/FNR family transcriptional regulator
MVPAFINYLRRHTQLSEEDIDLMVALAIPRKLKRNEALLVAGDVCRYKTFIITGLLRIYSIAADGSEPVLKFSPELSWALDVESYDKQLPATYHIAAIEPSEVLQWHKHDFETLLAQLPALKKYTQQIISLNLYNHQRRLSAAISATPEEKYGEFASNNPALLSRLPLRMIAAYLGISLKTLTRIRHAQWAHK